jgi:membrane fusion protein
MSAPLFRPEAREARATSWLGTIVLIRPLSAMLLTAAAGLIAFAILAYLVWGESHSKARVNGFLTPAVGIARAQATQAGVVEVRFVSEGDTVARGDPLVVIGDARASENRVDLASQVAASWRERQRSVDEQRDGARVTFLAEKEALAARAAKLAAEVARLDGEVASMRKRLELARAEGERMRALEAGGFVAPSFADRRKEDVLDQELRLSALEGSRLAALRDLAGLDAESSLARARLGSQLAALRGQEATLGQERIERGAAYRAIVTAPQAGTVASVLAERGQAVLQGATLLTILPADAKLEAHLFAPSRSIGFVRAGQPVLLRYPAFPAQKFGAQRARVIAVSRSALAPAEAGFTPADGSREPVYRIRVALESQEIIAYGKPEPLQAGMLAEADILLERRRIIEWIFDPLLSLAGRV